MDIHDKNIKPAIKAQYIIDNYSGLLNKSTRNKLHSWPDWLSVDPWHGEKIIQSVARSLVYKKAIQEAMTG